MFLVLPVKSISMQYCIGFRFEEDAQLCTSSEDTEMALQFQSGSTESNTMGTLASIVVVTVGIIL